MKIFAQQIQKPITIKKQNPVAFKGNSTRFVPSETDSFVRGDVINSYVCDPLTNRLQKVEFTKSLSISKAIESLIMPKDRNLQNILASEFHTFEELATIWEDLQKMPQIMNKKVVSLNGIGLHALAFETEDGKILKITDMNHFPDGRKPAFFDLPILESGSHNHTHYYLEEKVSFNNSSKELFALVDKIKQAGYEMKDYLMKNSEIKFWQFGKTAGGELYLIDPGCAVEPVKYRSVLNAIKKFLFRK